MFRFIGPINVNYADGKVNFKSFDLSQWIPMPKDPTSIVLDYCKPICDPDGKFTFLDDTSIQVSKQPLYAAKYFITVCVNDIRRMIFAPSPRAEETGSIIEIHQMGYYWRTARFPTLKTLNFKILWMDDSDMMLKFACGRMFYVSEVDIIEI